MYLLIKKIYLACNYRLSNYYCYLAFQEDVYNMIIFLGSGQFKINALSFYSEIYRHN